MKCPNCGAEIKEGTKVCDFCGSGITIDMQREQEQLKKKGCPSCSSTNISFSREKQGEVKGKKGTAVVRATVGVCKDCGYTWHISSSEPAKKSNKMVWWVLGWLFFFPAPVMVLIWRKKCKWDIKVKIGVTVAFWLLIFIIGGTDNSSEKSENSEEQIAVEQTTDNKGEDVTKAKPEKIKESATATIKPNVNNEDGTVLFGVTADLPEDTKLTLTLTNDNGYSAEQTVTILNTGVGYTSEFDDNGSGLVGKYTVTVTDSNDVVIATQDFIFGDKSETVENSEFNINELPVMNGTKTERIGTYSMCYMLSADCTDEVIAKWYREVKDKNYNWSIIRYADVDDKGIYTNNGIIEKDVQFDEDGALISSEGETIFTVNEDGTISLLE